MNANIVFKYFKGIGSLTILFVCLLPWKVNAQSDLRSNTTITVRKELKDWRFGIRNEVRLNDNISQVRQYFTSLTANYEYVKGLTTEFEWRYLLSPRIDKENKQYSRYSWYVRYKHKKKKHAFSYRLRYQIRHQIAVEKAERNLPSSKFRILLGWAYKASNFPLNPSISTEFFTKLDKENPMDWDKFRLTMGTKYAFNDHHQIKLFYRLEKDLEPDTEGLSHILGLSYVVDL